MASLVVRAASKKFDDQKISGLSVSLTSAISSAGKAGRLKFRIRLELFQDEAGQITASPQ
jgi:hypothetical protein